MKAEVTFFLSNIPLRRQKSGFDMWRNLYATTCIGLKSWYWCCILNTINRFVIYVRISNCLRTHHFQCLWCFHLWSRGNGNDCDSQATSVFLLRDPFSTVTVHDANKIRSSGKHLRTELWN